MIKNVSAKIKFKKKGLEKLKIYPGKSKLLSLFANLVRIWV